MLTKILFREYDYPDNIISCTQGSPTVAGTGTKFTEIPVNTMLEAEGFGRIGKILSIESDTSLTLDRNVDQDIDGVVFWQDWSIWRVESAPVNKKVESENQGESGAVVFDDLSMTFYMGASIRIGGVDYLNPVKAAFEGDIDEKKRFVIRKLGVKYDYPDSPLKLITSSYDYLVDDVGDYLSVYFKDLQSRPEFEGVVDWKTIDMPSYAEEGDEEEFFETITFNLMDKLTSLNSLTTAATRTEGFMKPDVMGGENDIDEIMYQKSTGRKDFSIHYGKADTPLGYFPRYITNDNAPALGDLLNINFLTGMDAETDYLGLITFKYLSTTEESGYGRMYYEMTTNYSDWITGAMENPDGSYWWDPTVQKWIDSLFDGQDIFVYEENVHKNIKLLAGITEVVGTEIKAIDGVKLINAILKKKWPDSQTINILKDGEGNPLASFPLPLNFIFKLLDEFPLGKEPLDALAYIVNAIENCYIFTDLGGNFDLQNNSSFEFPDTEPALTTITLDKSKIKSMNKKFVWDKIVDSVIVNVASWIPDPGDPMAYMEGVGYAFKVTGIKPRNELKKDVIIDQISLDRYGFVIEDDGSITFPGGTFDGITYPALTDQAAVLNQYGDFKAIEKMKFYGKRHECYDVELVRVTWEILAWQLLFLFSYNSKKYFMTNLSTDIDEDIVSFTMVSVIGYDYNLDNIIIGKQRDEYLAGN